MFSYCQQITQKSRIDVCILTKYILRLCASITEHTFSFFPLAEILGRVVVPRGDFTGMNEVSRLLNPR